MTQAELSQHSLQGFNSSETNQCSICLNIAADFSSKDFFVLFCFQIQQNLSRLPTLFFQEFVLMLGLAAEREPFISQSSQRRREHHFSHRVGRWLVLWASFASSGQTSYIFSQLASDERPTK